MFKKNRLNERGDDGFCHDYPFEGLGFKEWIKIIFRTRAQTLKQSDRVVEMLMAQNRQLCTQLEFEKASAYSFAEINKELCDTLALVRSFIPVEEIVVRDRVIKIINKMGKLV